MSVHHLRGRELARACALGGAAGLAGVAVMTTGEKKAIVCQHLSIARVAQGLGVAWNTANEAVLAEGKRVLINDENRFDGVNAIG